MRLPNRTGRTGASTGLRCRASVLVGCKQLDSAAAKYAISLPAACRSIPAPRTSWLTAAHMCRVQYLCIALGTITAKEDVCMHAFSHTHVCMYIHI